MIGMSYDVANLQKSIYCRMYSGDLFLKYVN